MNKSIIESIVEDAKDAAEIRITYDALVAALSKREYKSLRKLMDKTATSDKPEEIWKTHKWTENQVLILALTFAHTGIASRSADALGKIMDLERKR